MMMDIKIFKVLRNTVNKKKMSIGVKYILLSTMLFSLIQISVKVLSRIPTQEIIIFRSLISLFICLVFLYHRRVNIFGNNKKLLLARGFVGSLALFGYFYTIHKMPLATAISIHYLSPLFTIMLATFIMKEPASGKQWICFIVAFIGVVMIKGIDYRVSVFDILIGVFAAFMSGLAYNIVRKLKLSEDPLVVILYFPLVTLPLFAPYAVSTWVWPNNWEWPLLIILGLLTQIAQYALTRAYQSEKASNVAIFNYLGVIYAIIFGYFLFAESLPLLSVFGIIILLIAAVGSGLLQHSKQGQMGN